MKLCDACGHPLQGNDCRIGDALLCQTCTPIIRAEAEITGKSVNTLTIARQYFRDHHSAGAYYLRDIPRDLKIAAQHRALDEGITLRELILEALWNKYLQKRNCKGD